MGDNDDFAAWTLCWRISRHFLIERFFPSTETSLCIGCQKSAIPWSSKYRSEFVTSAVKCSAGHLDELDESADVCERCNQDFVLNVAKRRHICPEEGCRRVLTVDEDVVADRLGRRSEVWQQFQDLLDRHKTFECLIHGDDDTPLSKAPTISPDTPCNHETNICAIGLKQVLEMAITEDRLQDLKCPDPDCQAMLAERDIRSIVSRPAFSSYKRKVGLRNMPKDPNFRWCRANKNGRSCENGQIVIRTPGQLEWECMLCRSQNCFDCYHTICPRHQKLAQEEALTQQIINETTKKCPRRGCAKPIEYSGGCAHMTCRETVRGCGTDFCWNCKIIWKKVNGRLQARHLSSCRLRNTRNEPVSRPHSDDEDYAPGWDEDPGYNHDLDKGLSLIPGHQ